MTQHDYLAPSFLDLIDSVDRNLTAMTRYAVRLGDHPCLRRFQHSASRLQLVITRELAHHLTRPAPAHASRGGDDA